MFFRRYIDGVSVGEGCLLKEVFSHRVLCICAYLALQLLHEGKLDDSIYHSFRSVCAVTFEPFSLVMWRLPLGHQLKKKKEKTSCALHLDNFQVFRLITKPRILNNYCCKSIRVEYVLTSPVLQGEFPHILLDFLPCVKMYLTIVSTRKK